MLGGFRKTAVGSAALGLIALGLATGATPSQAAPGDDKACLVVEVPANVNNIDFHPGQATKGTWPGTSLPWKGLYYPSHDPVREHAVPRQEPFGASPTLPNTPVQIGDHYLFSQSGRCANSGFSFSSNGSGIGYCGRSVGLGVSQVNGVSSFIRWESVGSQLILLDRSAMGSVNARPNPPGHPNGSCTDGSATTFTVDGPIVDTRA